MPVQVIISSRFWMAGCPFLRSLSRITPDYAPIAACVDGADEVCKTYPKAYELAIKAQLFLMFHILFSQCWTAEAPLKNRKSLEKMKTHY